MFACRTLSVLMIFWPAVTMAASASTPAASANNLNADLLRGSPLLQQRQNQEADRENLARIENDRQLKQLERSGELVRLPHGRTVHIDYRLDPKWRWCRPQTADFIRDAAEQYFAKFHRPLQINSAVRTIEYQKRLRKHNANAAPIDGDERSSHLTGATVDIAKKYMSTAEVEWMQTFLVDLSRQGYGVAIEEYHQAVFHVMAFNTYISKAGEAKNEGPQK